MTIKHTLCAVALLLGLTMSLPAFAGDIAVEGAFARASAGPVKNGAAYLTVTNAGTQADRLVGAKTPAAARAELHTHLHEGGVMKMRPVEAIEIPAGGAVSLKPGGDHVMLMGLKAPLVEGESVHITLIFEKAGEIMVMVPIGSVGASSGDHGGHSGHGTKKTH